MDVIRTHYANECTKNLKSKYKALILKRTQEHSEETVTVDKCMCKVLCRQKEVDQEVHLVLALSGYICILQPHSHLYFNPFCSCFCRVCCYIDNKTTVENYQKNDGMAMTKPDHIDFRLWTWFLEGILKSLSRQVKEQLKSCMQKSMDDSTKR